MSKLPDIKSMKQYENLWEEQNKTMGSTKTSFKLIIWLASVNVLFWASAFSTTSFAGSENIVHRIKNTGILYVGTRAHAAPFASEVIKGQYAGFTIDLIEQISIGISDDLGRPITIKLIPVTTNNRLKMVQEKQVDIVCGSTTVTWDREKLVDFSIPFFIDGVRLLTFDKYASLGVFGLQTKIIGVSDSELVYKIIDTNFPSATIRKFKTNKLAIAALESGLIHAYSNDGVQLENLRINSNLAHQLVLLPRSGVLEWESFACVLPENQSQLKDLVNHQILKMLRGLDSFSGTYAEIYSRWFGADGVMQYPLDEWRQRKLISSDIWLR